MRSRYLKLLTNFQVFNSIQFHGNKRILSASPSFLQNVCNRNYVSSLTQNRVLEFIGTLKEDERQILIEAVKKFESEEVKFKVQEGEKG